MKFYVLIALFFFAGYTHLFSQTTRDSLLAVIKAAKHDTDKALGYEKLALIYRKTNKDSAFFFNNKAIQLATQSKNSYHIEQAYREYGLTAQANNQYPLAIEYYQKALSLQQKTNNKKGTGGSLNDIGVAYYFSGNYDKAREYFEASGKTKIAAGDSIGAGQAFNNTGIMHDINGNPTEALKLYLKALSIYENVKDTNLIIGTMSNIGLIYIGQKNYTDANKIYTKQKELARIIKNKSLYATALSSEGVTLDYLKDYSLARKRYLEALNIFREIDDKQQIAQCYTNLSANYDLTNEDEKSLEYALKAIAIKQEIGNMGKIAVSQIAAAKIYSKKANYPKAITLYYEAITNAQNAGYTEHIIKAHEGLSQVYAKTGDYKKAYEHQKNYLVLNDSVTNTENAEMISNLEKKFQSEKKEQEIVLLNKTNALKDSELQKASEESKRKSIQLYGSIVLAFILSILVIVVVKHNRQRKQANYLLLQKNKEITEQKVIVEKAHHQLEEKNKEILDSITYAKRIQTAILPPQRLIKKYLPDSFVLYKPKDIVAGDFYWLEAKNDVILFAAADCTGHGVPGAMVSVICNNGLNRSVKEFGIIESGKILDKAREIIIAEFEKSDEEVKDGMDISLCTLNFKTNKLQWSGANNPLWIIRQDKLIEYKADKQPIGRYAEPQPFTTHEIDLEKGDILYLFSDGYQDQFGGERGKKFKSSQLKELLLSVAQKSMEDQQEVINTAFEKWKGNIEQIDDVCVIGVRI